MDLDPNSSSANGWLEDVSKVEKYQISEEAYNARENTYRKFKEQKLKEVSLSSLACEVESPEPKVLTSHFFLWF